MAEHTDHPELPFFQTKFQQLLGFAPMPWQEALFVRFMDNALPSGCDIPTGLGKTAVMAIWLLALARQAQLGNLHLPRRLVYVVNRRTVVDQATDEADQMATALGTDALAPEAAALRELAAFPSDSPLAVSTLRGQFADNGEWRSDPARPAIVVGTVDMVGSRLLFSGYGCGFKSKPLHAGFIGQDALLVHDEAHLEPAFQQLIEAVAQEQQRRADQRPLRVLSLTATSRASSAPAGLTEAERNPGSVNDPSPPLREVWKRITARKGLQFHPVSKRDTTVAAKVAELARQYEPSQQAILVFVRQVADVLQVAAELPKGRTQRLTGTMRGLERDNLASKDPVFARFLPRPPPGVEPTEGTVYLVCTSAGEVGVNISADHLVCDLTPFDSMAQRLGRVNRFGSGDARIHVVHDLTGVTEESLTTPDPQQEASDSEGETAPPAKDQDPQSAYDLARARTLHLLTRLNTRDDGHHDASPLGLASLPTAERLASFSPPPTVPAVTDILFDAWALTSVRGRMPGRPPVADWIHGLVGWEPPETQVAWRTEVSLLRGDLLAQVSPTDLLADYPLKPHEVLRDTTKRVAAELKNLAKRPARRALPIWLRTEDGDIAVHTLGDTVDGKAGLLEGLTVLLPPEIGGLRDGTLDGRAEFDPDDKDSYDVADQWTDDQGRSRRRRVWDDEPKPPGMRQVCVIDCTPEAAQGPEDEAEGNRRWWRWYVQPRSADDDGSQTAERTQELVPHLAMTTELATKLAVRLGLDATTSAALAYAARWHDRGKARAVWQRAVGNYHYPTITLAKGQGNMNIANLSSYRHELGSLLDIQADQEFRDASPDVQDLLLHFVASHHGRARPHFFQDESFDGERERAAASEAAMEAPRRFARLQRRYGRWGLAYLESLLRAADALASRVGPRPTEQATGGSR